MKLYSGIIKIISNTIFLSVMLMVVLAVAVDNRANEAPIGSFETELFNEGWIMEKDGETEAITLPYSGKDFYKKQVILRNTLPDTVKDGMQLSCRSDLADIKIYIDGELRADYGESKVPYVGYYPPSAYEFVAINAQDAGKEIRLEILTKKNKGYFESITIGFGNNGWFGIITGNVVEFGLAIMMVGIGFIAILFYLVVRKKMNANRSIMFLGQTIMLLGVWTISESRLRQLIFLTPSLTQIFCYFSLEVLGIYVLFYFNEIQSKQYQKVYLFLETLNLGQLVLNILLAVFRIADLHDTLQFCHVWMGVSTLIVLGLIGLDLFSGRIKKYNISAVGMAVFIAATLSEIISYYVTIAQTLGIFLSAGLVVLLGATIAQTVVDAYLVEKRSREHVERAAITTIETIASAIDARDKYTGGHSERVAYYAELLSKSVAQEFGFRDEDIKRIHYIALMHDIGKIGIPDAILNKAGKLTDEEYVMMKQHAVIGDGLLKDVDTIEGLSDGVRHHHERYDGKGYPDGLAGEEIPLVARILCIADCFDAMTTDRIYRKRLSDEAVRAELERGAGTQFDPRLVAKFCDLLDAGELQIQTKQVNG